MKVPWEVVVRQLMVAAAQWDEWGGVDGMWNENARQIRQFLCGNGAEKRIYNDTVFNWIKHMRACNGFDNFCKIREIFHSSVV